MERRALPRGSRCARGGAIALLLTVALLGVELGPGAATASAARRQRRQRGAAVARRPGRAGELRALGEQVRLLEERLGALQRALPPPAAAAPPPVLAVPADVPAEEPPPAGEPQEPLRAAGGAGVASTPPASAPPASAPPASAPPDSGDVVESIDLGAPAAAAPRPAPVAAAPSIERVQAGGWLRSLTQLGLGPLGLQRDAPIVGALPYDRLINREQLLLRLRYARGRTFEIALSGLVGFNVLEQETASPEVTFNGFNGASARYLFDHELRDAYVGIFLGPVDIRLGQQRVAWGKGEFFQPNDVLNPRELRDPVLTETELLRVPVLLARVDVDIQRLASLQLVVAPFFVPDRVALHGENWALLQPDAPAPYRNALYWASRSQEPRVSEALAALSSSIGQREARFSDASVGARLTSSLRRFDLSFYYHYGLAGLPSLGAPPELLRTLYALDLERTTSQEFDAAARALPPAAFDVTYPRRHHVGLDVARTVGPFGLRLDAAYDSQRYFYDRSFLAVPSGVIEAVLSAEYQTGSVGKLIMLEASYLRLLDDTQGRRLYFSDTNTLALAALARWTFLDRLELELRGVLGIHPFSYLLRPQLGLKVRGLSLQLGAVVLGGSDYSFGDYFRRNRSLYLNAKWSF